MNWKTGSYYIVTESTVEEIQNAAIEKDGDTTVKNERRRILQYEKSHFG